MGHPLPQNSHGLPPHPVAERQGLLQNLQRNNLVPSPLVVGLGKLGFPRALLDDEHLSGHRQHPLQPVRQTGRPRQEAVLPSAFTQADSRASNSPGSDSDACRRSPRKPFQAGPSR